jgi:putative transposon-encoded protein
MVRKLELETGRLVLIEDEIEGFLERTVSSIGTSGKADIPRRYIGRRVYVIITKNKGTKYDKKGMK